MGRNITFGILGIFFGVVMVKSEAISWYRIHEMFRFESIHMYGIIGTTVLLSIPIFLLLKRSKVKTLGGHVVQYKPKKLVISRFVIAGAIFGLGWGLLGACPGPVYVLIGSGYWIFVVVLIGAVLGTYLYGLVRDKLPH